VGALKGGEGEAFDPRRFLELKGKKHPTSSKKALAAREHSPGRWNRRKVPSRRVCGTKPLFIGKTIRPELQTVKVGEGGGRDPKKAFLTLVI